ncbi:hypothetical protein DPMN_135603 [Dreissena polymorpha]|uniref:Peptidase C14 caspase domain-containing protein n=1 Tax=Dreissena polymorpha TaxID=45954 RepID=A0A9D4G271_DREPO|nr:hypothetical protein DPMN_135603 [Dreissena polymorpha]
MTVKGYSTCVLVIVLAELVTGLEPNPKGNEELRNWSVKQIDDAKQVWVWTAHEVAFDVAQIAVDCIHSVQYDCKNPITSDNVLSKLKDIVRLHSVPTWDALDNDRCDICLVNTRVNDVPDGHDLDAPSICSNRIRTCCSCLRNTYINPIQCHTCGHTIKSFINSHCGAVLVAGFDNDRGASNVFKSDIRKFKVVITSKIFPAMCLEDENVIVVPEEANMHSMVKTIYSAIDHMSEKDIRTLLFVYSGHNGIYGLRVGEQEYFTMDMLSKKLNAWKRKTSSFEKLIAIFDCCEPEALELNKSLKVVQLNATGLGDEAYATRNHGSHFLQCIIQAFTANATGGRCQHQNCQCISNVYGEFITLDKLLNCIDEHRRNGHLGGIIPTENVQNINIKNEILAYNYNLEVVLRFTLEWPIMFETNKAFVSPSMFDKFDELKRQLTEDVIKGAFGKNNISSEIRSMFGSIMRIEIDTGPKIKHTKEIDTVEMLLLEWSSMRNLRCTFRRPSDIERMKPAGHFLQDGQCVKAIHQQCKIEKPFSEIDLGEYIKWLQLCERRDNSKLLNEYIHIIMILQRKRLLRNERLGISFVDLPKGFTCAYMEIVPESSHS